MKQEQGEETRVFLGGMDFDSDDKSIDQGMYRILLNGRNGPRLRGVIHNVKGNVLIQNPFLSTAGVNKCIGGVEDLANNSYIFANWNSLGYHGWYRYYINKPGYANGVIEKLVKVEYPSAYTFDFPNPLDFDEDHLITGVNIVENLLYWTDGYGRPKMMNLDKANNTGKRKKFKICFNKSNFEHVVKYTLNVFAKSNPVPIGTMTWNAGGFTYSLRCDAFRDAYQASNLIQLFTISSCSEFIEIEMTSPGDYFVNITEVVLDSALVKIDGYFNINSYLIKGIAPLGLAIFDQIRLYGLTVLSSLNNQLQTIQSLVAPNSAFFNAPSVGINVTDELGYMLYLPETVTNPNPNQSMVIPQNFYPEKDIGIEAGGTVTYDYLRYDLFDRGKYPPQCMPTAKYGTDPSRETNLVKNTVWQFRAKYIYDNYENSVYGSVSNIPMPNISCDDNKNFGDNDNFIDVDYLDQRLNNPSTASIIKKVVLAVQEHNNGEWRQMQILEQHQFAGLGQNIFRFFNDQTYQAIPTAETNTPYDSIGRTVKSQEFVDDRLFDGAPLEGYNTPCIDANIDINYLESPTDKRYTVKGKVYIRNMYATDQDYADQQPIWVTKGAGPDDPPVFGGMGKDIGINEQWLNFDQLSSRYSQQIPLSGFTFYLAGTDYYGISKQNPTGAMGGNPWYSGQNRPNRKDIRDEINVGTVYSTFEIKDVPPGRYVLRVASHLITADDLVKNGRAYQKTSTYAFNVGGSGYFELVFDVTNADVIVGDSEIADISSPNTFTSAFNADPIPDPVPTARASVGICGYLVDNDLGPAATTYDEWLNDTHIERAMIGFNQNQSFGNAFITFLLTSPGLQAPVWNALINYSRATTDHNGFFWFSILQPINTTLNLGNVYIGAFTAAYTMLSDANAPFTGRSVYGTSQIAARQTSANITAYCKTKIEGRVLQNNTLLAISGASVVNTKGFVGKTDTGGDFSIPCYVDTVLVLYGPPQGNFRNDEVIIFEGDPLCKTSPAFRSWVYIITIQQVTSPIPDPYDYDNPYNIGNFFFEVLASATSISAEKRGADIQYALAYYDELDRRCVAITSPNLQKHFLFYTEKNPLTGTQAPYGRPVVSWSIFNEPPKWAVKYQWLRTANLQLNGWLQWGVNKALYISKNETDLSGPGLNFLDPDADFCVLDLQSIGYYSLIDHPDAVINFTFQEGDRIRFIADETGVFFPDLYDFEIVKVVGQNYVYLYKDVNFEIKSNYQFEVYSPRNRSQVNLFYEFGECFEVKTAVINGIRRKYHAGPIQDQTFGVLPGQVVTPATGTFKTGSAYYRRRQISTDAQLEIITPPSPPKSGGPKAFNVDDESISDFYLSKDYSIGRVLSSAEIPGEIQRDSAVRFSNRYITGTKVNGLSSFAALNDKQYSSDYGQIVRLYLKDNTVLVAVFSNSYTVSMYINQGILRQASGTGLIAISEDEIPRTHISQRTFGSSNPESIYLNDQGDLFGYDEKQGVVWRMSGNQMIEISEYKMSNYFKDKSVLRITKDRKKSKVISVYDLYYDEYVLGFNNLGDNPGIAPVSTVSLPNYATSNPAGINFKFTVFPLNIVLANFTSFGAGSTGSIAANIINLTAGTTGNGFSATVNVDGELVVTAPNNAAIYGNQTLLVEIQGADTKSYHFTPGQIATIGRIDPAQTIAFVKEPKNFWTSFYDFKPEMFGRIRNDVLSFNNGELWLHDKSLVHNNFYGVQYKRQLKYVNNKDWEKVKNYLNIEEVSENINYCPIITIPPGPQTPNGMLSELKKNHFRTVTNKFYAGFLRDKNTPLKANVLDAWINGRVLNGQTLTITLEDDSTERSLFISTKIHYFWSEYS